ncbi:MAG: regulatory protein RecX [Candidatus Doudnabacteria bacterium]|nr:regulatory protein RecX [Candidatus Doudnabacteria bacterium]
MSRIIKQEFVKAYEKAVKLLEIRLHTEFELSQKLKLRGFEPEITEQVLGKLSEQGLINDQQFAEVYLDNLIKYKTFGYFMLLKKLLERGIEKSMTENMLNELLSLEQEKALAQKFINKKSPTDREKLARSLNSRGFRSEVIKNILSTHSRY